MRGTLTETAPHPHTGKGTARYGNNRHSTHGPRERRDHDARHHRAALLRGLCGRDPQGRRRRSGPAHPRRAPCLLDGHLRGDAALLPRRRHRAPGRVRHRQRRRHQRRHPALPQLRLCARGGLPAGKPAPHLRQHGRHRQGGRGRDRHGRHQGGQPRPRRRRLHQHRRHRRDAPRRAVERQFPAPRRQGARQRQHRRPRHRHHLHARGALVRNRGQDRRRTAQPPHRRGARRLPCRQREGLPRPHARWTGLHAQRVRSDERRGHTHRGARRPRARPGARRL